MNAIESSSVMLLILSESANQSQQVSREIEEGVRLKIPIIPVIMGSFKISKGLMYFINSHQWIDAAKKPATEWIPIVVSTLKPYNNSNVTPSVQNDSKLSPIVKISSSSLEKRNKHRKISINYKTIYIVGILLLFITGYFLSTQLYIKQLASPISRYNHATLQMDERKYNEAFREFQNFATEFPDHPLAAEALYHSAQMAEKIGDTTSGNLYSSIAETYPQSSLMEISLFKAATSYESNGMQDEALQIHSIIGRDSTFSIPLRIPSLCKYADYLYDATAFESAEEYYIECIHLFDSLKNTCSTGFQIYLFGNIDSKAFRTYPARSAYRIALIGIDELNLFPNITSENVSDFAQKKGYVESWLGKCITYGIDEYFIASCGLASNLYIGFADAVISMNPPPGLNDAEFDEFYEQLYIHFYNPEVQKAVDIAVVAIERSLCDGTISDSEKELIIRLASCVDELSPGSTIELGIPDSVYSFNAQNHLQFELEVGVLLVSSSLDEAVIDGVITPLETERIYYYASRLDELSPGATVELGIPDSIYVYGTHSSDY